MYDTNQIDWSSGPFLRLVMSFTPQDLVKGGSNIIKYSDKTKESHKPLLYICGLSWVNFIRGWWLIWCKLRRRIVWFSKTVSPSPRSVRGRWFHAIVIFFSDGRKSVIERSWNKDITKRRLLVNLTRKFCIPWLIIFFILTTCTLDNVWLKL